ncbi:ABC transporter ATP-binding protein [Aestuariimicrobium kwangyangense]|uniref:ABC transporter ATP-binding protein n=1 Tax=Aestuariimicrobium kwangyangense TaxID=396389 RepID=UPI0003F71109|nr:ABC transporter ATP-binding protein [Aestuariimicrobium kwangyangense]
MTAMPPPEGRGGGGGWSPRRIDPADRRQLAESPVSLRRIARLFSPWKGQVVVVMVLLVGASLLGIVPPFLTREIIDRALPSRDVHLLVACTVGMVAVAALAAIFNVLQTWLSTVIGQKIMHRLRADVFSHLQRQSVGFFTRTRAGEVQSRITNDIGGMQSVVTDTVTSVASNLTTVIAMAAAMVMLDWRLSLVSLVVLPLAVFFSRQVAMLRREITSRQQRTLADLLSQVGEGLSVSGIRLTKTMGAQRQVTDHFVDTSRQLIDLEVRSQLAGRWRMATMSIVFAAIPAVLYLAAGLPGVRNGITIGTLVAFIAIQGGIFRPVMGLLNTGVSVVSSMALFSRIFGYLDLPVEVDDPADPVELDLAAVRGELGFDKVSYHYPGAQDPAVDDVSLEVPAGSSLALTGETGSGKSTLASLVARLADPTSGRITIDGVDIRRLRLSDLAQIVGVVSQETYLFHATIRENLLFAKTSATDDELWQALRAAQISSLIESLPQGLDTIVGERGQRFSGGEQQRLAIARVVLRNPRIIVLDEATSALDNDTEREVQRALDALAVGRTSVTIAHRLSTVRDADQIAVLDHGRVIEIGPHDDLVLAGGRYASLARVPLVA